MRSREARLLLGRARMDHDLCEIHCGKCGQLIAMDLSDLGAKRTVECSGCQAANTSVGGEVERNQSPRSGGVLTARSRVRKP